MTKVTPPPTQRNPHFIEAQHIAHRFGHAISRGHRLILARQLARKLKQFLEADSNPKGGAS